MSYCGVYNLTTCYILRQSDRIAQFSHNNSNLIINQIKIEWAINIIFDFTVGYQIFSDKLFERVFKAHAKPTKQIDYSPYQKVPQFKDIEIKENVMTAILPTMKIEQCAGHFDNFPILPVGVLAYMAINTIELA